MVGTHGYAPEQYKGKVEARTGLYALGATMHFMLTEQRPRAGTALSCFPRSRNCAPDAAQRSQTWSPKHLPSTSRIACPAADDFKRRLTRLKNPAATLDHGSRPRNQTRVAASAPTSRRTQCVIVCQLRQPYTDGCEVLPILQRRSCTRPRAVTPGSGRHTHPFLLFCPAASSALRCRLYRCLLLARSARTAKGSSPADIRSSSRN